MRAQVVVVGAGLAGLAAARSLAGAGVEVVVLEARDRVGGRICSLRLADGTVLDMGGQSLGPEHEHMNRLARELKVAARSTYDEGEHLDMSEGRLTRFSGPYPDAEPEVHSELERTIAAWNGLASQLSPEAPWEVEQAAAWDSQTLLSWIESATASPGARRWLLFATKSVLGAEAADMSLLHALHYVSSCGDLETLLTTGGGMNWSVDGGSQSIAQGMADALGRRVMLNHPIRAISQDEAGVSVEGDGFSAAAHRVIVAIPPALAGRLRYQPSLPAGRDQLSQRMAQGSMIKAMCIYPEAFWREQGLSGRVSSDSGAARDIYDNSPPSGRPGVLGAFIAGTQARELAGLPKEERRRAVLDSMASYFGRQALAATGYEDMVWAAEEYSRGCYSGFMPPGTWTSCGRALREPVGRIHWAGAETAIRWYGHMDGAVASGERAAAEVQAAVSRLAMAGGTS